MRCLPVRDFSPDIVPAGEKESLILDVVSLPSGGEIYFPTLVARGQRSGKVLVAIGGVHGDEYEGPAAIMKFYADLCAQEMSGTFIGIPVVNSPAFEAGTRSSPIDGADLARVFPGSPDGSISERVAYHLLEYIISRADLFVDLHSGGRDYAMPVMAGFYLMDDEVGLRSREAALAFGAETVWGSALNRGRSISEAVRRGIPSIYTEASGGARVSHADVDIYCAGLLNLLKHLGIVSGEPQPQELKYFTTSPEEDYWLESAVLATASGLYLSDVSVLDEVRKDEVLGRVVDLFGHTQQVVKANRFGRVMAQRLFPRVYAGDSLVIIA